MFLINLQLLIQVSIVLGGLILGICGSLVMNMKIIVILSHNITPLPSFHFWAGLSGTRVPFIGFVTWRETNGRNSVHHRVF